jgi:hypothetical protein
LQNHLRRKNGRTSSTIAPAVIIGSSTPSGNKDSLQEWQSPSKWSWLQDMHFKAALRQWLVNDPRTAQLIPTIVSLSCHNAAANVHYPRGHNVINLIVVPLTSLETNGLH